MNLNIFVECLTIAEINQLSVILYDKKREYAKQNLSPLHWAEKTLVDYGHYIDAIKVYRGRTGLGLFESKLAIDSYRGM